MTNLRGGRATAIIIAAIIAAASLLMLRPAMAAQTTASLFHYPSPGFDSSCSTPGSGTSSPSTVSVKRKGTELAVTVQLIGAAPNTTYTVSTPEPSCPNPSNDATFTTDGSGNGSVQYQKQVPAGTDTAIVSVFQPGNITACPPSGGPCSAPSYLEYRSAELKV